MATTHRALTKKKLRRLEITAGAPKYAKTARGVWSGNGAIRQAERRLAEQAEASYRRMLKDRQAAAPARKVGTSVTAERAWIGPSKGNVARQARELQTPAL